MRDPKKRLYARWNWFFGVRWKTGIGWRWRVHPLTKWRRFGRQTSTEEAGK